MTLDAGNSVNASEDIVERAVLLEQLGRGFEPDAGDAGDIVHRVSHHGLQVDDLLGSDLPVLPQGFAVQNFFFSQVEHTDTVANELTAILVSRADKDIQVAASGRFRYGSDDVVGFKTHLA